MKKTLVCAMLLAAIVSVGQAEVIYRETFPQINASLDREAKLLAQGWFAHENAESTADNGSTIFGSGSADPTGVPGMGIENKPVLPLDADDNPLYDNGMMFASRKTGAWAYYTYETPVDSGLFGTVRINTATNSEDDIHAIAQVDGQWYVSEAKALLPGQGSGVWEDRFIITGTSAWALGTFYGRSATGDAAVATLDSGFGSANGGVDALPDGTITGFGLYTPNLGGNQRFDLYEINTEIIPEPATMSLLALGGLVAIRRRRR